MTAPDCPTEQRGNDVQVAVDGYADLVRASHVLEHYSWRDTVAVMSEWARVLKPGGVLQIAVPNFDYIIAAYESETISVEVGK